MPILGDRYLCAQLLNGVRVAWRIPFGGGICRESCPNNPSPFPLSLEQVWGDGCFFEPFNLPGSKLEGIKTAFVDLLVSKTFSIYLSLHRPCFVPLLRGCVEVISAGLTFLLSQALAVSDVRGIAWHIAEGGLGYVVVRVQGVRKMSGLGTV